MNDDHYNLNIGCVNNIRTEIKIRLPVYEYIRSSLYVYKKNQRFQYLIQRTHIYGDNLISTYDLNIGIDIIK